MFILSENFTTSNKYDSMNPIDLLTSLHEDMVMYSQVVTACMTEEVLFSLNEEAIGGKSEEKKEKSSGLWAKVKTKVAQGLKLIKQVILKISSIMMNFLRDMVVSQITLAGGNKTLETLTKASNLYAKAYSDFDKLMKKPDDNELIESINKSVEEANSLVSPSGLSSIVRGLPKAVSRNSIVTTISNMTKVMTKCIDEALRYTNMEPTDNNRSTFTLMVVSTPKYLQQAIHSCNTTFFHNPQFKISTGGHDFKSSDDKSKDDEKK